MGLTLDQALSKIGTAGYTGVDNGKRYRSRFLFNELR